MATSTFQVSTGSVVVGGAMVVGVVLVEGWPTAVVLVVSAGATVPLVPLQAAAIVQRTRTATPALSFITLRPSCRWERHWCGPRTVGINRGRRRRRGGDDGDGSTGVPSERWLPHMGQRYASARGEVGTTSWLSHPTHKVLDMRSTDTLVTFPANPRCGHTTKTTPAPGRGPAVRVQRR